MPGGRPRREVDLVVVMTVTATPALADGQVQRWRLRVVRRRSAARSHGRGQRRDLLRRFRLGRPAAAAGSAVIVEIDPATAADRGCVNAAGPATSGRIGAADASSRGLRDRRPLEP